MMMSKNAAMAPMMACKTLAMPLTIAMRQAPMVRKREVMQDTTAPILRFVARCDFACAGFCWFVGEDSR
jgi:hypothetical protein